MKTKKPQYELSRPLNADSQRTPETVPSSSMLSGSKIGRRRFLGAGLGASAVLPLLWDLMTSRAFAKETSPGGNHVRAGQDSGAQSDGSPEKSSIAASLEYLRQVMDQFHNRFPVYDDVSSAGNHFHAWAKIPGDNPGLETNGSWPDNPHKGATSIRCVLRNVPGWNFGGYYFQNGILPPGATSPAPNFGTVPNAGVDISGATALTFWARGERGGEKVDFFMGGVGWNPESRRKENLFADSTFTVKILAELTTQWQQFRIDLQDKDLSYVLGGFGWAASIRGNPDPMRNNPNGVVFYLDDIEYELSATALNRRLNEPRFLRSFTTLPLQPDPFDSDRSDDFDLVLRNTAFTYDNALALLAFLADGSEDSFRRARLIGDAFVYAAGHDRTYNDGRLRSDYAAGDISLPPGWTPNMRLKTVPSPGFYVEGPPPRFIEIEQDSLDVGNNAWAMIALLALYRRTRNQAYLSAARNIGNFIRAFRNDTGRYKGFLAGINDPESSSPSRRPYASTEHNIDIYAAFTVMFEITGESQWQTDARHARGFIEDMWDADKGRYLAGTTDPDHRNMVADQLPLDPQVWAVLALPDALTLHPQLLDSVERDHQVQHHEFSGVDFNNDKDGVWFEGAGQTAVVYAYSGQLAPAKSLRAELRRAQQTPPFGDGFGIAAACHDGVTTGFRFRDEFPFTYYRRLHIAATAWNLFAQLGFNPYYQLRAVNVTGAVIEGKKLVVTGESFDNGAVLLVNGEPQKTKNDTGDPTGRLIAKKAGKKIPRGQTAILRVRNSDGRLSNEFPFTRP
jgi:hypothetical protein